MAKFILVCSRNRIIDSSLEDQVKTFCNRLIPDNIPANPPQILVDDGLLQAIIHPTSTFPRYRNTICLGHMVEPAPDWWRVGAQAPDGSYALLRSDMHHIELLTDVVGMRSIWYCFTDERFIASTSQRAIIALLGNFQFNESVIPWMLSTGSLGPEAGWDRRVVRLPGDARLLLDRAAWTIGVQEQMVRFEEEALSAKEFSKHLLDALTSSIASYRDLPWDKWQLSLSGGFDSRAILLLLQQQRIKPSCITMGLRSSLDIPNNDAVIAGKLADYYGLDHSYLELDSFPVPPDQVIHRFLIACEGRIDHLPNFMDGLETFSRLVNAGVWGIARGDIGFPSLPVASSLGVRQTIGANLLRDFFSKDQVQSFELVPQVCPAWMERQSGEMLVTWRDRLYQQFRMPVVLAALNDIAHACLETLTPLASRRITRLIRQVPTPLRSNKGLFKDLVRWMSPAIGFAESRSVVPPKDVLRQPGFVDVIVEELHSSHAQTVLSDGVRQLALKNLRRSRNTDELKVTRHKEKRLKRLLPQRLKDYIKEAGMGPQLEPNVFAFRAYIVSRMTRMFDADRHRHD